MQIFLLVFSVLLISKINADFWYSYQFGSDFGNREELVIKTVDAIDDFQSVNKVGKWKSVSLNSNFYAVGVTVQNGKNGVVLLHAFAKETEESFHTNETVIELEASKIFDVAIFHYEEDIIVTAAVQMKSNENEIKLIWFKIDYFNDQLLKIWEWNLQYPPTNLNVFETETGKHYLVVCNEHNSKGFIDLIEFQLGQQNNYWIHQNINLDLAVNSTAISIYQDQFFLTIPQRNQLIIYKLLKNKFKKHWAVPIEGVNFVANFYIGYHSYLAVGGKTGGIYEFSKKGLKLQEIEHFNNANVDFWMSIPFKTFRDEQILIAERSINFSTHKSNILEAILYQEGKFVLHDEMSCDYFGEISNGLNCLMEESDVQEIKDSTAFTIDSKIGILIPHRDKSSRIFMFHTEMQERPNPIDEEIAKLDAYKIKIQEKITKLKQSFPIKKAEILETEFVKKEPLMASLRQEPDTTGIEINTEELSKRVSKLQDSINEMLIELPKLNKIDTEEEFLENLIIDGILEVQSNSDIRQVNTELFNGQNSSETFADFYNANAVNKLLTGTKNFKNLTVDWIDFDEINGISREKVVHLRDSMSLENLIVLGDLTAAQEVEVNTVNKNISAAEFISIKDYTLRNLEFKDVNCENLTVKNTFNKFPMSNNSEILQKSHETIYIPGNLSVININDINFDELATKICMRNIRTVIPQTTVIKGNVNITNETLTLSLNDIDYPNGYIMSGSKGFSEIQKKNFTNKLIIEELTAMEKVNGINLENVVPLSEHQKIPGNIFFEQLKVTENFNVTGNITTNSPGNLKKFKVTLEETTEIFSNVNFSNLQVEGTIKVAENFNGTNLTEKLSDVIYKAMENAEITAVKLFLKGLTVNDLQVSSNSLNNNLDIANFVNKQTKQILKAETVHGDVTFENLHLKGLFNGIDVNLLEQQSVKISGEQFIASELFFENDLPINELHIKDSLNDLSTDEYLNKNSDVSLAMLNIKEIKADVFKVENILKANEENFGLEEFNEERLSLSRDQIIESDFNIDSASVVDLNASNVNGYQFKDLFGLEKYSNIISGMIFSNQMKIKDLVVESINVSYINEMPADLILKNCIANTNGLQKLDLIFETDVKLPHLTVESFNNIPFEQLKENLVFKNETKVKIKGIKNYLNGFAVTNFIQSSALNGINVLNIMRKNNQQELIGPIIIEAPTVTLIGNSEVGKIQNIPLELLKDTFLIIQDNTYQINGDVVFEKMPYIADLLVENLNGIYLPEFLQNLIPLHSKSGLFIGNLTFGKPVEIRQNLQAIKLLNGIKFNDFKENVVLLTQDAVIDGSVTFKVPVNVSEELQIDADVITEGISNVNLTNWNEKALFINRGPLKGNLTFESAVVHENIKTNSLNGIDMMSLIPLKSEQTIAEEFSCEQVISFGNIPVGNLVNNYKLEEEFQNTVLSSKNQNIEDNVIFENPVLINGNLKINNLINEQHLENLVMLNNNQTLSANYHFVNRTILESDAFIENNNLNNINLANWTENSLKIQSKDAQIVNYQWILEKNITFAADLLGRTFINDMDITNVAKIVKDRKEFNNNMENNVLENYKKSCYSVNKVIDASNKQIYKFKYLEMFHQIDFPGDIVNVHSFEYLDLTYMLISDSTCLSKLYIWSPEGLHFERIVDLGIVQQMVSVNDLDSLYFVTRDSTDGSICNYTGSNVWKFEEESINLIHKLPQQKLLHESKIPAVFYAMDNEGVTEFRITPNDELLINPVQKWLIPTENADFVSHGLKTGLAIRNGHHLFQLLRDQGQENYLFDQNMQAITLGNVTKQLNNFMPGSSDGEMLITKVGRPRWHTLLSVTNFEETKIKDFDTIKIYEDPMKGIKYQNLKAYKPSSLLSLEFEDNAETLIAFLEDEKLLKIYEYKGIEGFKFKSEATLEATKLVPLKLPTKFGRKTNFIAAIKKNLLNLIEVKMDGNQMMVEKVDCNT